MNKDERLEKYLEQKIELYNRLCDEGQLEFSEVTLRHFKVFWKKEYYNFMKKYGSLINGRFGKLEGKNPSCIVYDEYEDTDG